MGNILICIRQMGIGGVETVVLNHCQVLKQKGYNVFITGKFDNYTSVYEKFGAKCIDFEFKLQTYYDIDSINNFIDIMQQNKITEVHIHSIECIPYIFPACLLANIPYVVYIHGGYKEVYDWYLNNYYIYHSAFPLCLNNANKIIAITEKAKNNIINLFKIDDLTKFIVYPNSLNFSNINKSDNISGAKEKIIIVSRLAKDKDFSVINAINFFVEYKKHIPSAKLSILGTGNDEADIKEYVNKLDDRESIEFLGETNDVYSVVEKFDIVIGMGRCILEAIAMNKIAIISGHKFIVDIVNSDNIKLAIEENFTDRYTNIDGFNNTLQKLISLSEEQIRKIIEDNYNYIYENLNLDKNLYTIDNLTQVSYTLCENESIFELFNSIITEKQMSEQQLCQEKEEIGRILTEYKYDIENLTNEAKGLKQEIENLTKQNNDLREELEKIYHSRRWKYTSFVSKMLKK